MTAERHLLGVWNPSYAIDAMDAHLRVLLDNIAGFRARKVKEEHVHVWWGKVRSKNRLEQLPHLPDILAMDAELADQGESGRELHLYLTDYRSLAATRSRHERERLLTPLPISSALRLAVTPLP